MRFRKLYDELLEKHGLQGWWPLIGIGYHPGDYTYPKNKEQAFEICVGAILTQNTSWKNVEKALENLHNEKLLNPQKVVSMPSEVEEAIRPSGYYRQKARKLREFSEFFLKKEGKKPTRDELLSVWGIGKETADSILNYAYKEPVFVVDAYARRVFSSRGLIEGSEEYDEIRTMVEEELAASFETYQEFHALIVEEGKRLRGT